MQAEQLVVKIAQDFDEFYGEMGNQSHESTEDPLILTFDGKGIVMRTAGLRQATRKAAAREAHKLTTRLSKGEKRNRKRMAQVVSVHDITRHFRSAGQAPTAYYSANRIWPTSISNYPATLSKLVFRASAVLRPVINSWLMNCDWARSSCAIYRLLSTPARREQSGAKTPEKAFWDKNSSAAGALPSTIKINACVFSIEGVNACSIGYHCR